MRKVKGIVKSNLKKFLSLMLVAALVIGTINMNLFDSKAAESHSDTVKTTVDGVELEKKAVLTEINGNEATVQFDFMVKGSKVTVPTTTTDKVDIVFVMDMSGSMEEGDKIGKAKTAAKEFINSILTEANKDSVKMGVVAFAGKVKKVTKDNKVTYASTGVADVTKTIALTNNKADLTQSIDGLKIDSEKSEGIGRGTNFQAGINAARTLLAKEKDAAKIIVALTDGDPTYSFEATKLDSKKTALDAAMYNVHSGK
ncbi:MAG: VWA domain-containing protein, partial [Lachnospiraceae bacterium]|nr:VWA domain-containing protein [Lachnospiraceae bacterium]